MQSWYKIYKTAKHGNLNEVLSSQVASLVLERIKIGKDYGLWFIIDNKIQECDSFAGVPEDAVKIILSIYANKNLSKYNILCNAKLLMPQNGIFINMKFSEFPPPSGMYSNIYFETIKIIRHELLHLEQIRAKGRIGSSPDTQKQREDINLWIQYYLDNIEVEANGTALYLEAKKMHIPYQKIIDFHINQIITTMKTYYRGEKDASFYGAVESFAETYKYKLTDYINKRYPNSLEIKV